MSDEPKDTSGDATAADETVRRPRPAASAASRARRIGGGTAAVGARPAGAGTTASETDTSATDDTEVIAAKPAAGKRSAAKPTSKVSVAKLRSDKRAPADDTVVRTKTATPAGSGITLPAWVAWVPAAALLVAAIAVLAFFVADHVGGDSSSAPSQKERQTVLAAAKSCVAAMNSYKYTDIDGYERAGTKCTTGTLTTQFRKTVDTLIRKAAPTQKFTQTAQINLAGIEAVTKSGKQWTILVYGQLNITNKNTGKQGRVDPFAVVATMEKPHSSWVVARVKLLSSIGS